jgi:hypothetical protein
MFAYQNTKKSNIKLQKREMERERVQRNESANTTFSFLKRFAQKNIRNSFNILALRLKNKQIKIQILVDCYISHNRG